MSYDQTRKAFENVIEKPSLTDKLLSKPPFKFIADIVSNVRSATGYLKNEFTDEEISTAATDKDTKIAFLEKLIQILDDGSLGNVKAIKVSSGKEPEETNKMLQVLGTNAASFMSNGQGEKKKKKPKKEDKKTEKEVEEKPKKRSSRKDSHSEEKVEKSASKSDKSEKSEKSDKSEKKKESKREASSDEKKKKTSSSSSKERHKSSERKEKKKTDEEKKPKKSSKKDPTERLLQRQDSMIAVNGDAPETPPTDENRNPQDEGFDELSIPEPNILANSENETSAQSFTIQPVSSPLKTDDSGIGDSPRMIKPEDRPPPLIRPMTGAAGGRPMTSMGRPGTAASRPAPPKLKKKRIATVDATPQAVIELKSEIFTESIPTLNLGDYDNFIMENDEDDEDKTARISELVDEEDRGALVQKIMDTKAGIEDSATQDQEQDAETDKNVSVEKEKIKQLQDRLQDLTKAAYPLARLFDFANSMIKELERWRSEQRRNEQEEQNKKSSGFGDSSRLYNMIANLQKEISDMKEELSKARGRVLNNEKRIQLFISNV
ncbi:hypothetical protein GCK72_022197 [Caenorhabditis remanei]|uniref:Uncharacterized protein n=1 Tax=Caenorhabditis remanei TaxID=31234 RepID=A0A6A5FT37_CAERE|nr:hypothetical protein GCK72_022197 [Caenorhabditis remanei]KAF1745750.1 hypothetical protein GCK72_022197 [Caenorhabditis remanei]